MRNPGNEYRHTQDLLRNQFWTLLALFADCLVNNLGKTVDILDKQCVVLTLHEAYPRQTSQLARHRLSVGTDTACDLHVGRGR